MVNEINSEQTTQEKLAEERKLTNGELYQEKIKEAAYFRFLDIKEKIQKNFKISYRKSGNNNGLHFSVFDDGIVINDYTLKKNYELNLTYDEEKREFDLRETIGVNSKNWLNIPINMVMDLLDRVEDKMKSYHDHTIDDTRKEIGDVISGLFSDGKRRRFS